LQRNGKDTVDGLSTKLDLAPATIRRHLDILQRDSLVAYDQIRKGAGRPEYSFYLTESGEETLLKKYDAMLSMVVGEVSALTERDSAGVDGKELLEQVFGRLSARSTRDIRAQLHSADLSTKLTALDEHLSQELFDPETTISSDGVTVELHNCPFRSVALENQAICTYDADIIATLLDADVERTVSITDGSGSSCCTYTAKVAANGTNGTASKLWDGG